MEASIAGKFEEPLIENDNESVQFTLSLPPKDYLEFEASNCIDPDNCELVVV